MDGVERLLGIRDLECVKTPCFMRYYSYRYWDQCLADLHAIKQIRSQAKERRIPMRFGVGRLFCCVLVDASIPRAERPHAAGRSIATPRRMLCNLPLQR